MEPWESIHLLWFEALNICFIPTLHIEQFGALSQEGNDGLEKCEQIGMVRYFKCFYVDPSRPLFIGQNKFSLDRDFKPELQRYKQQLHIGAKADSQVHLFRSFDVPSKGAQFTGQYFKATGGTTNVDVEKYAFKSLRRGWHYVGVNVQEGGRIGPVKHMWIEGRKPLITIHMTAAQGVYLEIEQHSPYPSVDLKVRLERRRDEYPLEEFEIPISSVVTSFVFADAQALMHSDRVQFVPPQGFGLEIKTDQGPLSSSTIEYNSVNAHQKTFSAVEQLWRTKDDCPQKSPILKPDGVSTETWSSFSERFPVLADQVPILSNRGLDLEEGLKYFYDFPNILIQLLLQQPVSTLTHQIKGSKP